MPNSAGRLGRGLLPLLAEWPTVCDPRLRADAEGNGAWLDRGTGGVSSPKGAVGFTVARYCADLRRGTGVLPKSGNMSSEGVPDLEVNDASAASL